MGLISCADMARYRSSLFVLKVPLKQQPTPLKLRLYGAV